MTALGPLVAHDAALAHWQAIVGSVAASLGWSTVMPLWRPHRTGVDLVVPCPADRMFTATEINEYAWEAAYGADALQAAGFTCIHRFADAAAARNYFRALDAAEREPGIRALREEARLRNLPVLVDDDQLSIGAGAGSACWPLRAVPAPDAVPWARLHDVPTVLVTGSNGKTTTTRLIAALLSAWPETHRGRVGISCTEGVQIGGEWVRRGDYSGPGGAREVLRDPRVTAAVLETARGGILRRGLAVERAHVAVVTNVAEDHFGEYGVDTLDDLAEVKLSVAGALAGAGTLVLNADDAVLMRKASSRPGRVALFSIEAGVTALRGAHPRANAYCVADEGRLWLLEATQRCNLGDIAAMPLTVGGAARYNLANLAASALAAHALGIPREIIAGVLATFGNSRSDNPGRLERWALGDTTVLIDYAHNPDGLARLLDVSRSLVRGSGKLRLLLGQAGNRDDAAIAELAATAAAAHPDGIVIKELPAMLRGRAPGEVPRLLQEGLLRAGIAASRIAVEMDEVAAAQRLLDQSAPGDVIVLPVHQSKSRQVIANLLDNMAQSGWCAGHPVPPATG